MSKKKSTRKSPPRGAQKPARTRPDAKRPDAKGHRIALAGGTLDTAAVELTSRELRVHARRVTATPLAIPRSEVVAVVDLRVPGSDRTGLTGPAPLRRPPGHGAVLTAGNRSRVSVALVFRNPQAIPAQAARRMGLKARKGKVPAVDVLELCPADPDELLEALAGARIAREPSLYSALAPVLGTVDEPDEAASVSAERERAVKRSGVTSIATFALPVLVLAAMLFVVPGEARGQVLLLLGLWVGVGIVVGSSVRKSNNRTAARLGPPPAELGGPR